jgi:hypothetical protein
MGYPLTMGLRVCHPAGWVVDRRSGLSRRQRISLIVDFNGHFLYFWFLFVFAFEKDGETILFSLTASLILHDEEVIAGGETSHLFCCLR